MINSVSIKSNKKKKLKIDTVNFEQAENEAMKFSLDLDRKQIN